MMQLTFLLALPLLTLASPQHLGCYSSLPSSFSGGSQYQYQTSSYCASQCSSHSYFALTEGSTCICGDDAPDSSDLTDTCTIGCFGFGSQTCGGSDSYDVYSNGVVDTDSAASSSGGSTTTLTSSNTGTSTRASSTATTSTPASTTDDTTATNIVTTSQTTSAVTQEVSGTTIVMYSTIAVTPSVTHVTASVSSSASAPASASATGGSSSNKKSSTSIIGPAVGGAVGGLFLIALIVIGIIFWKRRQVKQQEDAELADSAFFSAMKRDNTFSSRQGHERQISNPFIDKPSDMVDQRLNPVMLGRRRISEGSLADEADYSRKILRVANPDDED